MKKIYKALLVMICTFLVTVLCTKGISLWLLSHITKMYNENVSLFSTIHGMAEKEKGNVWINASLQGDELVALGTSEFDVNLPQNITNLYSSMKNDQGICVMARVGTQNALQTLRLGSNTAALQGHDIVLVESLQWFMGDEIDQDSFMNGFSELQFYEFLHNNQISKQNKRYLCGRYLEMEALRQAARSEEKSIHYDFPQTYVLARLYRSTNPILQVLYQGMRPYYWSRYELLKLKDLVETYGYMKNLLKNEEVASKDTESKDRLIWEDEFAEATVQGQAACTNNDWYVSDDYYLQYLEGHLEERKDSYAHVQLMDCREWDDYLFLLSVCNDLGLKPYIINQSCNGYYYDFAGMPLERRQAYYEQISNLAKEYGLDVYDGMIDLEYEPYVFLDVNHPGWKGWLYVDKAVEEYFR